MTEKTENRRSTATPKLATIGYACERLNASRSFLYKLNGLGKIKFIKIGSATRVPISELERIESEGTE